MEIFVRKISDYKNKLEECRGSLIAAEIAYADGLSNPKVFERFLVSRFLVREILGKKLGIAPQEVVLVFNENRKPYVKGNPIYYSVSHSGDRIAIAVHENLVGVDIEYMKERDFESFGAADRVSFYKNWTLHEAEIKMHGLSVFSTPPKTKLEIHYNHEYEPDYMLSVVSALLSERIDKISSDQGKE